MTGKGIYSKSRETRRKRWGLAAAAAAVLALVSVGLAWREELLAREEREELETVRKSQARMLLSEAYLGKDGQALAYLARALLLDPESSPVRSLTATLLIQTGRPSPTEPLHHDTVVDSAAFSSDGRWALTTTQAQGVPMWEATAGGGARVWEAATGRLIHDLFHQDANIVFARFSGDGLRVVTISKDGTAQIVDTPTGQAVGPALRHPTKIRWVELDADGRRVVTVAGGEAQVWQAATGQPAGARLRHEPFKPPRNVGGRGGIVSATFSPDGRRILTRSETYGTLTVTARVWETETGRLLSEPMHDGEHRINFASFSRDGERVVTASHRGVAQVWEAATGQPVGERLIHARDEPSKFKTAVTLQIGPDGRYERVPNREPAEDRASYSARPFFSADLSPDGRTVVTASEDKTARLFEVATGQQIGQPMRHDGEVLSALFSPDGLRVVTTSDDRTARLWDAATGLPASRKLEHTGPVSSAAFSADGLRLVTRSRDGTARVWAAGQGWPVATPLRHRDQVTSASFSPDGRHVATASWDSTAQMWDAATGRRQGGPFRHQDKEVSTSMASFSPDGRWVLTASETKSAQVWDAATGRPVGSVMEHPDGVKLASFSPDGQRVLTATHDGRAALWEAATGKPLRLGRSIDLSGFPTLVAFSADGRWVVTQTHVDHLKQARVFDAATGKPRRLLRPGKDGRFGSFSPDGQRLATLSRAAVQILETETGQPVGEPMRHVQDVHSAVFSHDGRRVATASEDTTARVWDAATGQPLGEPKRHQHGVTFATFSPDGKRLLTVQKDATVQIWQTASGESLGEAMGHDHAVISASFSAGGSKVVTVSGGEARVWDAATGQPLGEPMRHQKPIDTASFSADDRRVVTAAQDATAQVWDTETGKPVGPLPSLPTIDRMINSVSFSADGRWLVTTSAPQPHIDQPGTARVWDAATGEPAGAPLRHERGVVSASISPDGKRVATTSIRAVKPQPQQARWLVRVVQIWNRATGEPVAEPMFYNHSPSFSPDGRRVVTAGEGPTAQVWKASTGKPVGQPMRHDGNVLSASFSPDGDWIVTASEDKSARVWDAATGKPATEPMRHQGSVVSAVFSPDSRRIVTASEDGTAQVWNALTGQPVGQPTQPFAKADRRSPSPPLTTASFSPDGQRVVTASKNGSARVWDAATGRPVGNLLRHHDGIVAASFHPHGRQVVTASRDGSARVWDVDLPACQPADLELVAALAEAIGGYRLNDSGSVEALAAKERAARLEQLRGRVSPAGDGETECVAFVRWHLTHPHQRTISPFSKMTIDQYLMLLPGADREDLRWEASGFYNHPLVAEILARDDGPPEPDFAGLLWGRRSRR